MELNGGKHVMLSYNQKSKDFVSKVYDTLVDAGIPTWMDINGGMKDKPYRSMAEAVENAAVVCCFMTPEYQKSSACEDELAYADTKNIRIVPSIAENELQGEKEEKLGQAQHKATIISTYEEIYGSKTTIDVKNIFEKCKDQTKKMLILGRAGIGKSTSCRYVTYQWAKGELWFKYQLVILIRLRLLTTSRYPPGRKYKPIDLVEKEYFPCDDLSQEDRRHFKDQCDKDQVLWLLDGYDEFVQNIPEQLKDVLDYICKTQHHILTSRPYAIALSYDVKLEITGFTNDNIAKYAQQFFDQIKYNLKDASSESQKLLNFLKSNASIWGVAHIPVNLELICSLWSNMDSSQTKILTMT
ncbi:unnamed protein product [Rotaria magnacalcarata]|uniref:TIR domain-containing protein n=1 Tax=Rotaria magnacalcarata TaxID=392030 RepID=A0A8S2KVI7_9BILA|nr:unnamed protein product [Rotaria magnacalcarata]CAF3871394.1 unnamed protein product [Rotaria magnacalcarata]